RASELGQKQRTVRGLPICVDVFVLRSGVGGDRLGGNLRAAKLVFVNVEQSGEQLAIEAKANCDQPPLRDVIRHVDMSTLGQDGACRHLRIATIVRPVNVRAVLVNEIIGNPIPDLHPGNVELRMPLRRSGDGSGSDLWGWRWNWSLDLRGDYDRSRRRSR